MKVPAKSSATGIGQRLFTRCSFPHVCVLSLFALGLQGTTSKAQNAVVLVGSGSSVPAPLYSRWAQEYGKRNPNIQMRYLPVGRSNCRSCSSESCPSTTYPRSTRSFGFQGKCWPGSSSAM